MIDDRTMSKSPHMGTRVVHYMYGRAALLQGHSVGLKCSHVS
jgi:hypothetical protein